MSDEPAPPAPAEPDQTDRADRSDPSDQLTKLQAELARANELHLRTRAEFANYQKRAERDRTLSSQGIKRDFIKALLPAFDALNLAIRHAEEAAARKSEALAAKEPDPLVEGVRAARDAFEKALAAQGAERIANTGTWDPDLHHPQAVVPNAELPDGTILEEIRPGYKVAGLVARHSEVVVSKRPAEKPKEEKPPQAPPESKGA
ncbi:MAG TPA: nucleotide exchange factor GrpE [Planctomycetota bacterium]|nr:nucleotide exchange factor GrpE [Planctomycetota bacterium]